MTNLVLAATTRLAGPVEADYFRIEASAMKLRNIAGMSPQLRRESISTLVSQSMGPPNGQMGNLNARLAAFEVKYEMTTDEMVAAFRAGRLKDTADIAQWLVLAKVRGG